MAYFFNLLLMLSIYFLFFYEKWRIKSQRTFLLNTAFYIYFVIVLFFTIMPFTLPIGANHHLYISTPIFIPFNDLMQGYVGARRDIILNILMMVPFGFLLPLIRLSTLFKTIFSTFLFSLSIESYQLLNGWFGTSSRIFDVTDLITNTTGGFLGYLLFSRLKALAHTTYNEDQLLNKHSNE